MIRYLKGNLFISTNSLAHCISGDFKMGAGIAKEFNKRWGTEIRKQSKGNTFGYCATIKTGNRYIFNLVTKRWFWNKPSLTNGYGGPSRFELAIQDMFEQAKALGVSVISMPRIGCGLDKLHWKDVRKIIEKNQGNIVVEVYSLK